MTKTKTIAGAAMAVALLFGAATSASAVTLERPAATVGRSDVTQIATQRMPDKAFWRTKVRLRTDEAPGTIIVDTNHKYLYLVEGNNKATRYGIGVGRDGFGWSGVVKVQRKAEWPGWTPPKEMIIRERKNGHILPAFMEGGINNPLGARALYLYKGQNDSGFRIHGTNQPWTIGQNMSSGCIRMMNKDVEHLYDRASIGAKVIVVGPGNRQGEVSYDDRGVDILRTIFGG
jgi:lipoprotein-anchoring transpeptidase ErfK/SrfK